MNNPKTNRIIMNNKAKLETNRSYHKQYIGVELKPPKPFKDQNSICTSLNSICIPSNMILFLVISTKAQ